MLKNSGYDNSGAVLVVRFSGAGAGAGAVENHDRTSGYGRNIYFFTLESNLGIPAV